ncbi:DUF397 domain-containing protein [Streptomyces sp. KM273126]|uniref:DUF397 domain-containing protein n=1 Tax=Streptomyces sp. KM273126 TaxID=2545247 RepID=UPI00103BE056|nr:DUF397 domain-containing protein [Streptomyces sp. KM273126]MBA2806469.1 DUF397 domain-containing protein [Streptomyces sp. KM273126]
MPIQPEPQWFKSSYSGGSGTECLEAAFLQEGMAVRDSKDSSGPRLSFSAKAWADFVTVVRGVSPHGDPTALR